MAWLPSESTFGFGVAAWLAESHQLPIWQKLNCIHFGSAVWVLILPLPQDQGVNTWYCVAAGCSACVKMGSSEQWEDHSRKLDRKRAANLLFSQQTRDKWQCTVADLQKEARPCLIPGSPKHKHFHGRAW